MKIVWKNNPINDKIYSHFISHAEPLMSYAPMNKKRLADIGRAVIEANATGPARLTGRLSTAQGASIIGALVTTKIVKNWPRMNSKITSLARKYAAGANILALAGKHDFPPLNLLRGILLHQGARPDVIFSVFARKGDPVKFLSERDLQQFHLAEEADASSVRSQREMGKAAQEMEDKFVEYVRGICPRIKTQDELVKSQTKEFGRAVSTPDVLFDEAVLINGEKVKWIDFKSYTLTPVGPIWRSTHRQAEGYLAAWGTGALCYRGGFPAVPQAAITGVLLLDCSDFGEKIFN